MLVWSAEDMKYVPEPLRTEAVYLAAVVRNGGALEDVPEPLRTEAVCLAAVTDYGMAIAHVPKALRTEAICKADLATYERIKAEMNSGPEECLG